VFNFYLDTTDTNERFQINTAIEDINQTSKNSNLEEPYLQITAPRDLLIMLLIGHVSWNIADAAFFLDYNRAPNVYDPEIYALLNFLRV